MKALEKKEFMEKVSRGYSLKCIKGNIYVYRWEYIRKSERNGSSKKRFRWIYVGPWSGKGKEYIKSLSSEEYEYAIKEELYERLRMGQIKKKMLKLTSQSPFSERRTDIDKLNDRELETLLIDELQKDLKRVATEKVDKVISEFTIDSFYDFIQNGGDLSKLDIDE